ncbi:MAG: DUF4838 domain-containing protein [Candidatus Anammoximicrobium sp.]|nr:DUF4838 domain-containing protein [Candidatus Anammoximicrobium sp.]
MKTATAGFVVWTVAAVVVHGVVHGAQGRTEIVHQGVPRAVLVLQPNASEQLQEAAGEMQRLIQQASGAKLEFGERGGDEVTEIHLGRTPAVESLGIDLAGLDGDGFVIQFPDARTIVVRGPTDWGTEFGIYEFLERYVGVRWLMPGPDGTHVPPQATIAVPREPVREQPAFFSRKYFGLRLDDQQRWARRNRLHSRIEFHHQLYGLFPRSDIQKHPDFFPLRNGERYLPPPDRYHAGWQPCFTAPGIVDAAVERIAAFFDAHPEAESYSLGVTDSGGHCQCDRCRALDAGRKNMVGRDHLSDRYFTWVNAVIDGVLKRHPDKWFGCLAYSEIFEPPDRVKIHPRMIPYMTYDRMQWIDPEARQASEELTRRWAQASPVVGWYDYIYGAAYLVPRVYPHVMGEYYRFAHQNGVRGLTAEAYPNFGEGPKLYVSLKLQWDPTRDVDQLLEEWYEAAVGPQAAPYVKKYYDHWEDFWTRRIRDSAWWTKGRQYLPFHSPSYLRDVTAAEVAQCRHWLELALSHAGSPSQRARAELLLKAFEYYEASALAYSQSQPAPQLATETDALAWLETAAQRLGYAEKRRRLATQTFRGHPFLQHGSDLDRHDAIAGHQWCAEDAWALFDWLPRSDALRARLAELAAQGQSGKLQMHAATMQTCLDPHVPHLTANASFEEGDQAKAAAWNVWLQDQVGRLTRCEEAARSGTYGMLGEGIQYGGPHQTIAFAPGRYCLVASLSVPPGQPDGGFVDLSLRPLDEAHRNLQGGSTTSLTPTPGTWHAAAAVMDVRDPPSGAARIRAGVWVRDFPAGKRIYIDDVRLILLPAETDAGGKR